MIASKRKVYLVGKSEFAIQIDSFLAYTENVEELGLRQAERADSIPIQQPVHDCQYRFLRFKALLPIEKRNLGLLG